MVELADITNNLVAAFPVVTGGVLSAFIIIMIYNFTTSQINRLKKQDVLDANTAFLLNRGLKWLLYLLLIAITFNVLGIQVDFFIGLWVLAGGTIIGFASMNTIGNAIAGLIIMFSRPFKINDMLFFQGSQVIVEDIDLIYTRMRTLDNVVISVPNNVLIESVIENQSIYDKIRRRVVLTMDYSEKPEKIKELLLESIGKVEEILPEPEPYVWITDFGNYAMEYSVFYHIASNEKILEIDAKVKNSVFEVFNANNLDLSTPNLIQSV